MTQHTPGTPDPDPHNTPGPDPYRTPGLEPGGSVPPGETPPAEDSTSGAGPRETYNPTTGWAKGPMAVIIGIGVVVVVLAVMALILIG